MTWIGCAKSNFRLGRGIYSPKAIVIHLMDGTLEGTDTWFNNPASMVSSHYGIGTNGTVHQYVAIPNTAFHAGAVHNPTWPSIIKGINPNQYTIGIEHEGKPVQKWTNELTNASVQLVASLCKQYSISVDALHIIGHHEIYDGHSCPGPLWNKDSYVKKVAEWETKLQKLS